MSQLTDNSYFWRCACAATVLTYLAGVSWDDLMAQPPSIVQATRRELRIDVFTSNLCCLLYLDHQWTFVPKHVTLLIRPFFIPSAKLEIEMPEHFRYDLAHLMIGQAVKGQLAPPSHGT